MSDQSGCSLFSSKSFQNSSKVNESTDWDGYKLALKERNIEPKEYYNIRIDYAKKMDSHVSFSSTSIYQPTSLGRSLAYEFDNDDERRDFICSPGPSMPYLSKSTAECFNKQKMANIIASEVEGVVAMDESGVRPARSSNYFADPENKVNPTENDPVYNISSLSGSGFIQTYCDMKPISKSDSTIIYLARHRFENIFHAIKRVGGEEIDEKYTQSLKKASKEIQVLDILDHKSIVYFYTSWSELGFSYLKLEYCVGGSLADYFANDNRRLKPITSSTVVKHIGSALDYMYSEHHIIHAKIDAHAILIQVPPSEIREIQGSDVKLDQSRAECHSKLDHDDVSGLLFKLSNFGSARKVDMITSACMTREPDAKGLAKLIASKANVDSTDKDLSKFVNALKDELNCDGFIETYIVENLGKYASPSSPVPEEMDLS